MFEKKVNKKYLKLAKIAYGGELYYELENYKLAKLDLNGTKFQKINDSLLKQKGNNDFYSYKSDSGFVANLFEEEKKRIIIVAYRGTERFGLGENVSDAIALLKDVLSDINLMSGNIDEQFTDAWKFYKLVKKQYPKSKIIIIGQSLGGALAQIVSAKEYTVNRNRIETYTYNAPGCAHLLDMYDCNTKYGYPFITNYSVMNDWCGMFGQHVGQRYLIKPIPLKKVDINNNSEVINNILLTTHEGIFEYDEKTMGKPIRKPKDFNQTEGLSLWYFDKNNYLKNNKSLSDFVNFNFQGLNLPKPDLINIWMSKLSSFIKNCTPDFIKNSEVASKFKNTADNIAQTQAEQTEKLMANLNNNKILNAFNLLDSTIEQLNDETYNNALKILFREFKFNPASFLNWSEDTDTMDEKQPSD